MKSNHLFFKVILLVFTFFTMAILFNGCCTDRFRLSDEEGEIRFRNFPDDLGIPVDTLTGPFRINQWFTVEIISFAPKLISSAYAFSCDNPVADEIGENQHFSIDKEFVYKDVIYPPNTNWFDQPALSIIENFSVTNNFNFEFLRSIDIDEEFLNDFQIENGEITFDIRVETLYEPEIKMEQSVVISF